MTEKSGKLVAKALQTKSRIRPGPSPSVLEDEVELAIAYFTGQVTGFQVFKAAGLNSRNTVSQWCSNRIGAAIRNRQYKLVPIE